MNHLVDQSQMPRISNRCNTGNYNPFTNMNFNLYQLYCRNQWSVTILRPLSRKSRLVACPTPIDVNIYIHFALSILLYIFSANLLVSDVTINFSVKNIFHHLSIHSKIPEWTERIKRLSEVFYRKLV